MPDGALAQLLDQMETEYSYLDVLALALAESGVETFTGDSVRWSTVIRDLRGEYPELLHGIWFSERGYSEQLEDFFRVMARAGVLSFANPRYERINLARDAAAHIKEGAPSSLQEHEEHIGRIAERLKALRYEEAPP